jgi:phospholipase B1
LQIGSNDICQLCLAASLRFGPGSADDFEENIRETLEYIRTHLPNTLVNLLSVFKVSDIYPLTLTNQQYCSKLVPFLPHANIECSCALLGGKIGEFTRSQMDDLQTQYNERLVKIVKDYQIARDPSFAVIWQPVNLPLAQYPIEALSDVDCFHPSTLAHERLAMGVWNSLTSSDYTLKSAAWPWADNLSFRCLEEADRIPTNAALNL